MPEFNAGEFNGGEFNAEPTSDAPVQPVTGSFVGTWTTTGIGGGVL
jgi:hypothetical protein